MATNTSDDHGRNLVTVTIGITTTTAEAHHTRTHGQQLMFIDFVHTLLYDR